MSFLSIGEAMVELSQAEGDLWRLGFAGDTLNTAWYARACLPADWQVAYFTRIGTDRMSDRLERFIAGAGIDTRGIARDPARTVGLYAIDLTDGERSFTYWRGQSAARHLAEDVGALERAIRDADCIYASGITLAILPDEGRRTLLRLMGEARRRGQITAFDPNIRPQLWDDRDTMRRWLTAAAAAASIALPSFDDERAVFGDSDPAACAARWQADGAGEVVVKNGGGPMALATDAGVRTLDQAPRRSPRDSTGAGDSFNGGYLAARLTAGTPEAAVARAHALAMVVIDHPGALVPPDRLPR
ncbi:MAG: sugar kinase [Gemmobacter sp.]